MTARRLNGPMKGRQDNAAEKTPYQKAKDMWQAAYKDGDTYFVAGRTMSFDGTTQPISFDQSVQQGDSGMTPDSGIYDVLKDGKYVFEFQGVSGEANTALSIRLKDGKKLATTSFMMAARQDIPKGGSVSMKTTANLKKGDTVSVWLEEGELQKEAVFTGKLISSL